jgi:hypothetical protein
MSQSAATSRPKIPPKLPEKITQYSRAIGHSIYNILNCDGFKMTESGDQILFDIEQASITQEHIDKLVELVKNYEVSLSFERQRQKQLNAMS